MPLPLLLNLSLVYLILCGVSGFLGRHRRIGFWGFFFLSIILTPLLTAAVIFFASPAKKSRRVAQRRT